MLLKPLRPSLNPLRPLRLNKRPRRTQALRASGPRRGRAGGGLRRRRGRRCGRGGRALGQREELVAARNVEHAVRRHGRRVDAAAHVELGFFSTTLDILLDYLGVKTLILTGLTGDICVLFTAHDAYMRDFNLVIPADCVASNDPRENEYTLRKMHTLMDADIGPSDGIDFEELKAAARREPEPNPEPEPQRAAG